MTDHTTRRTVLAAVASGVAGAGLATGGSQSGDAAVTLGQFSVADHDAEVRDVTDVRAVCDVGYQWDVPDSQAAPEMFQVRLLAGESETEIGTHEGRASQRDTSATGAIDASLLDSDDFAAPDFEPDDGSPVSVDVPLRLELEVIGDNTTLATASQSTTGTVTVSEASYDAALHGSVGGSGEFVVEGE